MKKLRDDSILSSLYFWIFFDDYMGQKKYALEYEIVIRWTTIDYDINSSFSFKKNMTNHYMIVEN